jgi:arabinogalactan oligomer/maltooligosaccharide transport system substrate-binding protein
MAANPNVSITVVNKDVEALREDFLTSSLAGNAPDLLWTVADHVGPFTASSTIMPLDGLVDESVFLPNSVAAVQSDGSTWGVPISYGNHLMLFTNKDLVPDVPADSDAMIAAAQAVTDAAAGDYGLVMNQTESFWLVPFLGAFGGSVFAEDGITPSLDTEAMVSALTFLHDLKYADGIMPAEADYNVADGLFKDGKAGMIINGDWTVGEYAGLFGESLGVGPIPPVAGGDFPEPYAAGSFFMVSDAVADDEAKQAAVLDFIDYATAPEQQVAMVDTLRRLPANATAVDDSVVTDDPFLAGSAEAILHGIPQPTNLEMRCVFDSMTAGVRDLFSSESADPAAIAAAMQASADAGVAPGGECGPA